MEFLVHCPPEITIQVISATVHIAFIQPPLQMRLVKLITQPMGGQTLNWSYSFTLDFTQVTPAIDRRRGLPLNKPFTSLLPQVRTIQ